MSKWNASEDFAEPITPGVRSEDGSDFYENDEDGKTTSPGPLDVTRELKVLKRSMELNFESLHDSIKQDGGQLNAQKDENYERFNAMDKHFTNMVGLFHIIERNLTDIHERFDTSGERFDSVESTLESIDTRLEAQGQRLDKRINQLDSKLDAKYSQLKALQDNARATYINSPIHPVAREDGLRIPTELSSRYSHVHKYLRLTRRKHRPALAAILRFYGSSSWPSWGHVSFSLADEEDGEDPLEVNNSLEDAIKHAPEIALEELARFIGLNYQSIMINAESYEKLQRERAAPKKRAGTYESMSAKRERLGPAEPWRAHGPGSAPPADGSSKPDFTGSQSITSGQDDRAARDRTSESQRPHAKDTSRPQQQTLSSPANVTPRSRQPTSSATSSQTSVASSDVELPTRRKR